MRNNEDQEHDIAQDITDGSYPKRDKIIATLSQTLDLPGFANGATLKDACKHHRSCVGTNKSHETIYRISASLVASEDP